MIRRAETSGTWNLYTAGRLSTSVRQALQIHFAAFKVIDT